MSTLNPSLRPARPVARAPALIVWACLLALALTDLVLTFRGPSRTQLALYLPLPMLASAAALLILAVKRIRGHILATDALFALILLNPLFVTTAAPFDRTLVGAGLLGLLAAAIVGMQ